MHLLGALTLCSLFLATCATREAQSASDAVPEVAVGRSSTEGWVHVELPARIGIDGWSRDEPLAPQRPVDLDPLDAHPHIYSMATLDVNEWLTSLRERGATDARDVAVIVAAHWLNAHVTAEPWTDVVAAYVADTFAHAAGGPQENDSPALDGHWELIQAAARGPANVEVIFSAVSTADHERPVEYMSVSVAVVGDDARAWRVSWVGPSR